MRNYQRKRLSEEKGHAKAAGLVLKEDGDLALQICNYRRGDT
jgi:hypothetical protein